MNKLFARFNKKERKYKQICSMLDNNLQEFYKKQAEINQAFDAAIQFYLEHKTVIWVGKDYESTIGYKGIPVKFDPRLPDYSIVVKTYD